MTASGENHREANEVRRRVRLLLVGAGNVGRTLMELLDARRAAVGNRFGLELSVVGVADRSGYVADPDGLDLQAVVATKAAGRGVATLTGGHPGGPAPEMAATVEADLLVDASPVSLTDGQPGLACVEAALARRMHVVSANKGPLVLAFARLQSLANAQGVHLGYDATVCGGLPAIELGRRDLAAAKILRVEGLLNLTANYILTRMAEGEAGFEQAVAEVQAAGHAESDLGFDLDGWDAASKLVILANSVLGVPATLADVQVTGITRVSAEVLSAAAAAGKRVKLLALAQWDGSRYSLRVAPTWLDQTHPFCLLGPFGMGVVYHTDICGIVSATIVEETPLPTASAVLRDIIAICGRDSRPVSGDGSAAW